MAYFASDFQNVDAAGTTERFAGCLRLQLSLPFYRAYKQTTFELMRLRPGASALEIGCGTGDDAVALARLVGPQGRVTAVDRSRAMLDQAEQTSRGLDLALHFEQADARRLPYGNDRFDAARVDRTLQHIAEPAAVIGEMARVVRPGGRVVAMEPDWETFTVDSTNRALTRTLMNHWCDSFPAGWIGRALSGYFAAAGLTEIDVLPVTLVLREFALADQILDLVQTARSALQADIAEAAAVDAWLGELAEADRAGAFFCSFTAFIVAGTKPA
ncbi:MAG: class I SAM-dependent methyltransferase [Methylotetracoccus sp.]